ncbi:MAG: C25 family cysteine peptidase, partial [Flavobacteriales bacterium]|nr:C25 family cysteine peptidase [Flavobacteriales bacterium]
RYFFIIGKGRTYNAIRTNSQLSSEAAQNFAVPTFGRPGGDNLLLATHENSAPIYALGRLAVSDAKDIRIYLDKVKGYENLQKSTAEEDRAWRKEIIHLGGGTSPGEQNNIQTQLGQMETIIQNNDFGGNVFTFTKTSSDPIQQSQSGLLTDKINQGVNIITFFGHAGTGGFDFSIEDPSTYENEDKYPAIFSLGCLSGQIHSDLTSIGERFVFQDKKGAIAFVATTGFGYIGPLSNMQKNFYQNIGGIYYGKGIGEILKASLENSANLSGVPARSLNHQYTLNGDPAIILQSSEAPDFLISKNSATFEPEVFSAQQDSFSFKFDLQNIGRASVDSLELEIARTFPNNSRVTLFRQKIKAPKFQTTLSYTFPVFQEESAGLNRMHIDIDPQNEIEEVPSSIAENNNQLKDNQGQQGVAFYVYPNGIQTVSPRPFAIVSEANISLKATSADIFAPEQTYVFQLDTIDTFESPFLKTYETIQTGGVISWTLPEGILENEKVYYWRVSPQNANGFTWDESSFIYRPNGSTGWNQSHRDQIKRNQFFNTELEPTTSQLKYLDDFKDLGIKTGVYPTVRPELSINNTPYRYIPWDNPTRGGVQIAVLDEVSGDPWFNIPISSGQSVGQYGSNIPSWVVDYALFPYSTREKADRDLAMTFLDEVIPSGSYVIFMTTQETNFDYEPEEWAQDSVENGGINLFNILENQGAELIRQTAENGAIPYFLVYKKDDPQFTPIEGFGQLNDVFSASVGIAGSWDNGNVETDQIGPASSWETLSWNLSGFSMDEEEIKIELWGIRVDSSTQKLLTIENQDQGLEDLSIFSTDDFPFLKLEYTSADTTQRTPPNLDFWRVEFEGITDLAINPNKGYSLNKDTLRQGELLQIELSIENVGSIRSDSAQLDLRIVNTPDFEIAPVAVPPIDVGETTLLTFNIDTRLLSGPQRLELQLNSARSPREYSYQNNFGIIPFEVQLDNSNPILDVTFDGKYILNGDLVSASPLINIIVKDDNDFLFMSDTTLFNVLLKYPGEVEHRRVGFDESQLLFEAASATNNNRARLQFNPNFTEDGIYEMIIQAEDVSGNQSGDLDYKIQFEVITESSISNILNYPNPFSTSTQFVYTLTGSEVPEDYVLQIMTVSGRMVRELTPIELGPLSIGTHRTDYAWDGTDQYGDQLANGVYLYRFLIKDKNGEAIKKYDNGTDRFFKNNIGKMVILR